MIASSIAHNSHIADMQGLAQERHENMLAEEEAAAAVVATSKISKTSFYFDSL